MSDSTDQCSIEWNPIKTWTKLDHVHQCVRAYRSRNFENFILHFLCLKNNAKNEPQTECSLRAEISKLTGWDPICIGKAITRLINDGEFERVRNRSNHVRLNPRYYNRFRHDTPFENKYTGKQPNYSKDLQKLADNLTAMATNSNYYRQLQYRENGENEMTINSLNKKIDELTDKLDKVYEVVQTIMTKVTPNEAKEIERHLKLINGGLDE